MTRHRLFVLSLLLALSFFGTACGPATPLPRRTPPSPSQSISERPAAPSTPLRLVQARPAPGTILPLRGALVFTFNKPLDQASVHTAFRLNDASDETVEGTFTFPDERTVRFQPAHPLTPESTYTARFTTALRAADGTPLAAPLTFTYTTEAAFAVLRVFPAEDSEDVATSSDITVVFNKPVVALTDRASAPDLPLQFKPAIRGTGRWISTAIYLFHPDQPLLSNTRYTVTLPADTRDQEGNTLGHAFRWSFHTAAVAVDSAYADQRHLRPEEIANYIRLDAALQVRFSAPMDEKATTDAVYLRSRNGVVPKMTAKWNDDGTVLTLTPQTYYTPEALYELVVDENARARDGGLIAQPVSFPFQTAGVPRVISIEPSPEHPPSYYRGTVYVVFDTYFEKDAVAPHLHVSPRPPHLTVTATGRTVFIQGLTPGTTYTITFDANLTDLFGQRMGAPYTFTLATGHRETDADFFQPPGGLGLMRAGGPQQFWFHLTNVTDLALTLYRHTDADLIAYLYHREATCALPSAAVGSWQRHLDGQPDDKIYNRVLSLSDLTGGQPLQPGVYCVQMTYRGNHKKANSTLWLAVVTDQLLLETTPGGGLVWVTDADSGEPQGQLPVTAYIQNREDALRPLPPQTTNADGLAFWRGSAAPIRLALIHTADHFAIADAQWGTNPDDRYLADFYYLLYSAERGNLPVAFIYTDRPLYRPGQKIFFKGVVRREDDLRYSLPDLTAVRVSLYYQDKMFFQQRVPLSPYGTFHGSVTLPEEAPTGTYSWRIDPVGWRGQAPGKARQALGWGSVRVAAYHKPVFQVALTPEKPTLFPGEDTTVHLQATYYAGDAVNRGQVAWYVAPETYTFQPPEDYAGYVFYKVDDMPWDWWEATFHSQPPHIDQHGKGTTDAEGKFTIPVRTDEITSEDDVSLTVWASVTDRGGNTADGFTEVVLRRSNVYVGLHSNRWLGAVGQPLTVDLVVLDAAGKPQPNHDLTLQVARELWHSVQQRDAAGILRWKNSLELVPVQQGIHLTTDEHGKAQFTFTPTQSGTYRFTATARDQAGRERTASLRLWVAGRSALLWERQAHSLLLVPDHAAYHPGDTAHLLAPQPFAQPAYGLLTVARGHIFDARVVRLDQPENILPVPITGEMAPQVYASLVAVGAPHGNSPPDFKEATVRLPVALDEQQLTVHLKPDRPQAEPGQSVTVSIETTTTDGQPVPAEVSLAVVDKAIYALAPDTFDLLARLYPRRALSLAQGISLTQSIEAYNARAVAKALALGAAMGSGGGDEKGADLGGVITLRQNFRDTAYWRAVIQTDDHGQARITIPLPDNMTTWVLTARAITRDTRVGRATTEITVSRPFFVRLHTPAFFTGGDQPTIQAVVHNTTDAPLAATVRLTRADGLTLQDPAEQRVTVPARGQAAVTWHATVPLTSARVDLTVEATAGAYRDASRPLLTTLPDGGIPVQQFVTTEAVGTAGVLRSADEVQETVTPPANTPHATLRLDLAASLTAGLAQTLTAIQPPKSACIPTWADNLMTNAAAAQALQATGASFEHQNDLDAAINRAIRTLQAYQRWDGGWGWCNDSREASPHASALAAFALALAKQAGYPVSESALNGAVKFLMSVLHASKRPLSPAGQALIIDALARLGARPTADAYRLAKQRASNRMTAAGTALLLDAATRMDMGADFITPLVKALENQAAQEAAAAAWWDRSPGCWWGWSSSTATTALAVEALLRADPEAPMLPAAVRWLMTRRQHSRWSSDAETALAVLALADWARLSGEAHPNYQAEVSFNGQTAAEFQVSSAEALQGRSLAWSEPDLRLGQPNTLSIRRGAGSGALYYDAYLQTVLPAESVDARADGIAVSRRYALVDDLETPTTTFPVGAVVQVRLTVVVPHDLHQVRLTDNLPAGLEALDPNQTLAQQAERAFTPTDFWRYGWGWWYFYHREAYDDRVVFVADTLPAGVYTVTYYARAAVPGQYQARPAVAFATFFPDIRGRTAGTRITVLP